MKIYFAGSIRGGRGDKKLYLKIIKYLKQYGEVLTEHVGDEFLTSRGEKDIKDNFIYNRDMQWLKECDIVIAEVTTPSLGVGYEIRTAIEFNKKVVCLFCSSHNQSLSAMLSGNKDIKIVNYLNFEDLKDKLVFFNNY